MRTNEYYFYHINKLTLDSSVNGKNETIEDTFIMVDKNSLDKLRLSLLSEITIKRSVEDTTKINIPYISKANINVKQISGVELLKEVEIVPRIYVNTTPTFDTNDTNNKDDNTQLIANNELYSVYGYILKGSREIVFFNNLGINIQNPNNIKVIYPTYNESSEDYINKCTYGKIYTDRYSQNRLLVNGNENEPNCDWWNEDITTFTDVNKDFKSNDLLYFPSENYNYYGRDSKAIKGYDIDTIGKVVVFKESEENEPTIYFRETNQVNGQVEGIYEYKLACISGNVGSYPINNNSIVNFNGYTYYLSNNKQIERLNYVYSIKNDLRYSESASYYINSKLKEYSLDFLKEHAFLRVIGKWLYVVVGQVIYASRYDEINENKQLEWYVLNTHILDKEEFISDIKLINDMIYITTNKGNIFKWENKRIGVYEDIKLITFSNQEVNEHSMNREKALKVRIGSRFYSTFAFTFDNFKADILNGVATFPLEDLSEIEKNIVLKKINDNKTFCVYLGNKYEIAIVQLIDNNLVLTFENMRLNATQLPILFRQNDNDFIYISNIDYENNNDPTLKYVLDNEEAEVHLVNEGDTKHTAFVEYYENVSAVYVSAPLSFGTLNYYKNIFNYTLTNDTRLASELYIATLSNSIPFNDAKYIGSNNVIVNGTDLGMAQNDIFAFSLDDFNFETMSLSQDYVSARSYTKYRNILRQRFTDFVFYNKNNTNAVLSNMTLDYTITTPVVGGE